MNESVLGYPEDPDVHYLNGETIEVGGEGMIGFYDEILPRFMNKYGKKWGTKVEDVELPNVEKAGRVMHSVAVTEEMRESVMEGQTMFSRKRGSLTKETVEKGFGGIWIADKQEYAKFVSAVNNYVFEEDGEGIAYTDNYFYAYYWNIDGEPIPFASVHLNAEDSQDVVNQVNKEIGNDRKGQRVKEYLNRGIDRAWHVQNKDNANDGDNSGLQDRRSNGVVDSDIQRKGRYFYRPDLYVKTQRTDRRDRQTKTDYSRGRERGDIDDTRFSRKMGEAKAFMFDYNIYLVIL